MFGQMAIECRISFVYNANKIKNTTCHERSDGAPVPLLRIFIKRGKEAALLVARCYGG
jgi:hypothetical protein